MSTPITSSLDYKDAWLQKASQRSTITAQQIPSQNRSQPVSVEVAKQPPNELTGTITVEVRNDKGEIVGIAQKAVKDLLRRESR
jgi:hypothetical protein